MVKPGAGRAIILGRGKIVMKSMTGAVLAAVASMSMADAQEDPNLWLEEVEGEAALDWVRSQNEQSLAILESDPRFAGLYQEALHP